VIYEGSKYPGSNYGPFGSNKVSSVEGGNDGGLKGGRISLITGVHLIEATEKFVAVETKDGGDGASALLERGDRKYITGNPDGFPSSKC
jgi:hypothetical protein